MNFLSITIKLHNEYIPEYSLHLIDEEINLKKRKYNSNNKRVVK